MEKKRKKKKEKKKIPVEKMFFFLWCVEFQLLLTGKVKTNSVDYPTLDAPILESNRNNIMQQEE